MSRFLILTLALTLSGPLAAQEESAREETPLRKRVEERVKLWRETVKKTPSACSMVFVRSLVHVESDTGTGDHELVIFGVNLGEDPAACAELVRVALSKTKGEEDE